MGAALVMIAAAVIPAATHAEPLPVRDQNPLLAGYAIPSALPTSLPTASEWALDTTFSWGSSAIIATNARESLVVDAETRELRVALWRALPNGFAIGIELPWRQTTGGSLDGFIDDWHDAFGLPEGDRPSLPQDQLRIAYLRDGSTRIESRGATSGLGDASINLGKQLLSDDRTHVAAWAGLKLPTGDADDFSGSGSVDVSLALAGEQRIGSRFTVFGHIGGAWLGDGDRLRDQQRNWLAAASVGASAQLFESLTLTAQFDAHTAVYDDVDMDFLGDAGVLSLGGTIRLGKRYALSLAVSEDIIVESAPDVVFLFGLEATF